AHGDGDKKLAFSEPARLLHEALLEERNDHEATAERERPRLEEERQELAEHGANGHVATAHHEERYADKERGRRGSGRAYAEERPVIQDTDNPAGDADLDREGSRERLTDGDALTHLLLGQPLPLADHLAFHLADERDRAAEAEQAEAQIVPDKLADGHAPWRLLPFHR